jgi:hypothetical protein
MKLKRSILIVILAVMLIPGLALATSNVTGALYTMQISINHTTAAKNNVCSTTYYPVFSTLTTGGFADATFSNIAMRDSDGNDVVFGPMFPFTAGNYTNIFVPSLAASESTIYTLYTATCTGGKIRFFPGFVDETGYSQLADGTLELGSDFAVEIKGFMNFSGTGNRWLIYKGADFMVTNDANNRLLITVTGGSLAYTNATYLPSGALSGEHTIKVYTSGGNLKLDIDGVERASTAWAGSITDNASPYYYFVTPTATANALMPYVEYVKVWVGGTLKQNCGWSGTAANLLDLTGNGYNISAAWRQTNSDVEVLAAGIETSFKPVSQPTAPAYAITDAGTFVTGGSEMTGEFTTDTVDPKDPISQLLKVISEDTDTPAQLTINLLAGFLILAISLSLGYFSRQNGVVSTLLKAVLIGVCMAIAIALQVFDTWMLLFFSLMGISVILASRRT